MVGAGLAILADAHVAGGDARHAAFLVVEHLGRGEARIDLDAQRFRLLRQPAADIAEADDEVALVVHLRRRGQLDRARGRQIKEVILAHRRLDRSATLLPVREKLVERARLEHRTGEDVRTHLRALLDHADGELAVLLGGQLLQTDRGREPARPRPDDDHVELHRFTFHASLRLFSVRLSAWPRSALRPRGISREAGQGYARSSRRRVRRKKATAPIEPMTIIKIAGSRRFQLSIWPGVAAPISAAADTSPGAARATVSPLAAR